MQTSGSGTDTQRTSGGSGSLLRRTLPALGAHLYTVLVFAVVIGCFWLASTLSHARTFAEVKPVLQTALAPLTQLFGAAAAAPEPDDAIVAHGQIVALDSFDVASRVSARVTFVVDEGATVAEGDVIARFDDSAARASITQAQQRLADARKELAAARAGTPADADALDRAYDEAAITVSDVYLNFAWIFASAESVLHGNDLRESRANAYIYADQVRRYEPDIDTLLQDALGAYERTSNAYAKAAAAYRGMPHDASPQELDAALDDAYALLEANADTLKRIGDFLAVVRGELENEELEVPDELAGHEASIADALRTTNDNLEAAAAAREAIRVAKEGVPGSVSDIAALESAVKDAERDVAQATAALGRYQVVSPASGVVTDVQVPEKSSVVDGEIIATVAAEEIVARVALSEADVALVEVGEPVELSLDGAGFALSGQVLSIDSAASVENGVVAFYALVGFPDDDRVRAGMTATARIAR